ncbi:MAG TPA: HEAT repeat domain-containing protein [Oculatellaceae cyanobacterium]
MLDTENDPDVLCALGWGLGHLDLEFPTRCLTRLSGHSDSRVRYGVVGGILRNECPEAIAAKILLSKDDDVDVRNWATFGLGTMEMDNDEIRHALAKRLDDSDCEVRFEAISGLAKRGDTRVLKCVQELIAQGDFEADAIALAKFLRDPRLLPTLQHCTPADEFESKLLEDAIKACESAN